MTCFLDTTKLKAGDLMKLPQSAKNDAKDGKYFRKLMVEQAEIKKTGKEASGSASHWGRAPENSVFFS